MFDPEEHEPATSYKIQKKLSSAFYFIIIFFYLKVASKLRTDIEVTCFSYEGIEAIKEALQAGADMSSDVIPIQVKKKKKKIS